MATISAKGRPKKADDERIDRRESRMIEGNRLKPSEVNVETFKPIFDVGKYGQKVFDLVVEDLKDKGVMSISDLPLLSSACKIYNAHVLLEIGMEASVEDRLTTTDKGNVIMSAMSNESIRLLRMFDSIISKFGVTPYARQKISIAKDVEDDEESLYSKY